MVVAIITESRAMIFVGSGARDDVHRAHRRYAGLQIEVEAGDLELLNRIHRIILPGPSGHWVNDVSAVYCQSRQIGIASADRDVEQVVRAAGAAGRNAHARFE